ncbi:hypothetical protein E4T47_04067 [Aureobasidium subglaciale]|nr:hypothetical protein E4T47_04067 [Aureobasidium subglaciale]
MPIMRNAQPFQHIAFYLRECSLRPSISLINTRAFSACPIWKEAQEDPDLQKQHRLEQRNARKRRLYATSRAVREQTQLACHKYRMMRGRADLDYRVTNRARSREHEEAKRREPFQLIRHYLSRWIHDMPAIRESLTWPNHRLSWSEEPVERYCANCDRKRLGGMRQRLYLWVMRTLRQRQSCPHAGRCSRERQRNERVSEVHTLVTPPNTALPLANYKIREPHDLDLAFSQYDSTLHTGKSESEPPSRRRQVGLFLIFGLC